MYASCDVTASTKVFASTGVFGQEDSSSLFSSQSNVVALETPDLKVIQDNTVSGISTPSIVSAKVLGDVFGGTSQDKKDILEYVAQPGDTYQSIADENNISLDTLLLANELTKSSGLKVGQSLVILPTDGILYVVASGDTIGTIAQTYKSQNEDIITFNSLSNQNDIYVGDVLVLPKGVVPKKAAPTIAKQVPLADNYFILPVQGRISQGLHYYNGVDVANSCGTPVYAAAAGLVQRSVSNGGYNGGFGNHITILHSNGTVTYYGHLSSVLVKPGDSVYTGQNIGLVGKTGKATGCHLHFQVIGAKNPLAKYAVGTTLTFK